MFFFRHYLFTFLFLLVYLLTSCEFQPDEIPMNDRKKPADSVPILLNLNDYHDTIRIGCLTNFNYSISGTDNKILEVEIMIGSNLIHKYVSDNHQSFSFVLDPSDFPDGNYTLDISIITLTGSGSIAEKFGAEGYMYEIEWPLFIDKSTPGYTYLSFEKVHSPEGLKLSWTKFNHPNFVRYEIYRQYPAFQQVPVKIAEISDPEKSSFTDNAFWEGQEGNYFVRIVTPIGNYDGNISSFKDTLKGIKAVWHNDGTLDVSWDKAQNVEMFGGYYVFFSYGILPMESFYIANIEENNVKFHNTGFANGILISLTVIPKSIDYSECDKLTPTSYTHYTIPEIPLYDDARIVSNHEFILLLDDNIVYRYFPDEKKIDGTLAANILRTSAFDVSNDGNRFAYYQDDNFYIKRTSDFAPVSEFKSFSVFWPAYIAGLSLSANNMILASDGLNHVYLYESTGELIRKDSVPLCYWTDFMLELSPDGTKMAATTGTGQTTLFALGTSGWSAVGTEQEYVSSIHFSDDGLFVYIVTFESLIKRNTSDFGIVSRLPIPFGFFSSIDVDRERFLQGSGAEYSILDLNTGQVIKTMNLGTAQYTLFKNHIITSGRQLELPQF